MADNLLGITSGLFGVTPTPRSDMEYALKNFRGLTALDISGAQLYSAGRELGRGLMQAAGVEDPELASANRAKQIATELQQQGVSMQSSQGMKMLAQKLSEAGDFRAAQYAASLASQFEQQEANVGLKQAQTEKITTANTQEERLREALAALPDNATDEDYLRVYRQFGTPDQQARAIEARMRAREARAAKAGEEVSTGPGPVGKSGAFRDINGTIRSPAEMKTIRQEFDQSQKLMDMLNEVTVSDVKNAKSFIDWTTKPAEAKSLASSKTLTAQTKLAASQLIQQIESLPPGSASDADMRAAMKEFPGYSDENALAAWVNRTKTRLQRNIDRISSDFGFNPRTVSSGLLDLKGPSSKTQQQPTATQSNTVDFNSLPSRR